MQIELKLIDGRLVGWGFPRWGSELAAGLDLHACLPGPIRIEPGRPPVLIGSGCAIRIGDGDWCGFVAPRSGLGHRGLVLGNTVGVIDADYEGEVTVSAWNRNAADPGLPDGGAITIEPGDRIAQLVFVRVARPRLEVVTEFSASSARGAGGFGSTGVAAGSGPSASTRNPG
jgi:dUTP pyrophosphatase